MARKRPWSKLQCSNTFCGSQEPTARRAAPPTSSCQPKRVEAAARRADRVVPWGAVPCPPSQERRPGEPGLRNWRGVVVGSQCREGAGRWVSITCTHRAPERRTSARGRALNQSRCLFDPAGARHETGAENRAMRRLSGLRGAQRGSLPVLRSFHRTQWKRFLLLFL